jgi:hypothetical protein
MTNTTTNDADAIKESPLCILFGDHAKTRMLTALADAYPQRLTGTDIVENAGLGSRQSWYDHKADLLATDIVIEDGSAGNSPLYRLAEPTDDDPRTEWLLNLRDVTGATLSGDLNDDNTDDADASQLDRE